MSLTIVELNILKLAEAVQRGEMTLDEVPERFREGVRNKVFELSQSQTAVGEGEAAGGEW